MDVDQNSLELIERRLSERVEGQVRDRLFRFYRVAWAVALAVLGFFGYNVIAGLNDLAEEIARDEVGPAIEAANRAASDAERQLSELVARMTAAEEFQRQRQQLLVSTEHRLAQDQSRVEAVAQATDERLEGITQSLSEAEAQLEALGVRIQQEVAGAGSVDVLAADLQRVANWMDQISASVRDLQDRVGGSEPNDLALYSYEDIELSSTQDSPSPAEREAPAGASGTVYLQFAGVERGVAEQILAALGEIGYTMPGAERTSVAAGMHEVRYFFDSDADRAARLVSDVNRILADAGYRDEVSLEDFTGYYGGKPREGTLELWLEPTRGSG
ncbi:hypothetical protein [Roseitranquillus sediminis]|uniref:hypothetical protein n=1 Tax=Roseitranquillus sediminis TaxID=2809051 RepID=UPI001D0CD96C|nr:hypothetical protein [Roseitranquillus sediminis]MBM9594374.1 hypothetical protein [Roseitranquillus sediminis]